MTQAWTDGRHAENDQHVELDYEVSLANVTEGVARSRSWVACMASGG